MSIFEKLFSWKKKMRTIEMRILEEVCQRLSKDAGEILKNQIALINKVQRLDKSREVNLYHLKNGRPSFPDGALFPNKQEEFQLATLHLRDPQSGHESKVKVWMVKGHVFSLEFSAPPGDLNPKDGMEIRLLCLSDPMREYDLNP
jgi:hypothetical protein